MLCPFLTPPTPPPCSDSHTSRPRVHILSIDWIQDTAAATTKWGEIGDWDVSGVTDFSYSFTEWRDSAGGSTTSGPSNTKVRTFVGTDLVKWNTASVTTMKFAFAGALAMNIDMSKWNVAKVTTMHETFSTTTAFEGTGLANWDTTSVTTLEQTFDGAAKMNVDISGWNVAKVTSMVRTFSSASSLTSCTKRTIADAWASTAFAATTYPTDWANEKCDPKVRGVRQRYS